MSTRSSELAQLMLDLVEPVLQAWFENNSEKEESELLETLRDGLEGLTADLDGFAQAYEHYITDDTCMHERFWNECSPCRLRKIVLEEAAS